MRCRWRRFAPARRRRARRTGAAASGRSGWRSGRSSRAVRRGRRSATGRGSFRCPAQRQKEGRPARARAAHGRAAPARAAERLRASAATPYRRVPSPPGRPGRRPALAAVRPGWRRLRLRCRRRCARRHRWRPRPGAGAVDKAMTPPESFRSGSAARRRNDWSWVEARRRLSTTQGGGAGRSRVGQRFDRP